MKDKNTQINNIYDMLERKDADPFIYHGIAEDGYPDKTLLTANWNKINSVNLTDYIENELDIKTHWCDEWMSCTVCDKAVRSISDSYGWQPSYVYISDCEIACPQCWEDYIDNIIEYYGNSYERAIPYDMIELLEKEGFTCYKDEDDYCTVFENGWYPGQNDNPESIAAKVKSQWPNCTYIFAIQATGQFDIHFVVLIKK